MCAIAGMPEVKTIKVRALCRGLHKAGKGLL